MAARLNIPLVFFGAVDALKTELERLATGLDKYAADAAESYQVRPAVSPIQIANCAASFDVMTRVAPATDQTIYVQLPRPNTRAGGRRILVARMNQEGTIVIIPVGTTINGYGRIAMSTMPGVLTVWHDGAVYLTDLPGSAALL